MSYLYDPKSYRSPQRVWDAINQQYLDLWTYQHVFRLVMPDGRVIEVVPPFEYDKGSVPGVIQNWLRRDDKRALIAFLVHDWLYEKQQIEGEWITRKEADEILYGLLRQQGVRYSQAKAVHIAVWLGGWRYFNPRAHELGNTHYIEHS